MILPKAKEYKPDLSKPLEWVYVYIGEESNKVGYIGRTKDAHRLSYRINEHRSDDWYNSEVWKLILMPCLNRCESELMETMLISGYSPKNNVDKLDWGSVEREVPDISILPSFSERDLGLTQFETLAKSLEANVKNILMRDSRWKTKWNMEATDAE